MFSSYMLYNILSYSGKFYILKFKSLLNKLLYTLDINPNIVYLSILFAVNINSWIKSSFFRENKK